jgi:dUTPase
VFKVRLAGEGLVDVGYVGAVMLIVMNLHGLRIDVRFERILGIRKWR